MLSHPEYRQRYWQLAKDLEAKQPDNIYVLEGLADLALQQKNLDGVTAAIHYLDRARTLGSTQPSDFEQLAKMLIATHQEAKAINVVTQGTNLIPYNAELYRLLIRARSSLNQTREACIVLKKANKLFPQDDNFRNLLSQCRARETAIEARR
jgi:predicted Zn-dependent protease